MALTITSSHSLTTSRRWLRSLAMPTPLDLVVIVFGVLVPIRDGMRLFSADGDVGRHLRVGTDILRDHALFFQDHYSFTMFGKSFVPYEWLSEVLYTIAYRLGGFPGITVLAGLVFAATYGLVLVFLNWRGVDPLLAFLTAMVGATVSMAHWLARPHLFTPLASIGLLFLLESLSDRPGRSRLVWSTLPLFALWANLHGGFLFGLVLIAAFLIGDLGEAYVDSARRAHWLTIARSHGAVFLLAVVGSILNPSGPALFVHVTSYLGNHYLIDHTEEYFSPNFHQFGAQIFLALILILFAGHALRDSRPTLPRLTVMAITLAFGLYSVRNIPLFVVSGLPLGMLGVAPLWTAIRPMERFRSAVAAGQRGGLIGVWSIVAVVAVLALGLARGKVAGDELLPTGFSPEHFPVAAVAHARAAGLTGRIFNEFTWGGYLLYAWPEERVFIDGQTDFYGAALTREYNDVYGLGPGWRDDLAKREISLVLVPTDSLLARELAREAGWSIWYRDSTATLLRRDTPGVGTANSFLPGR